MGLLSKAVKAGKIKNPPVIKKEEDKISRAVKDRVERDANDPTINPDVYDEQMADPNVSSLTIPQEAQPVLGRAYSPLINAVRQMPFEKERISGANLLEQLKYYAKNFQEIEGSNLAEYKFMDKRGLFKKYENNPKQQYTKKEILDHFKDFDAYEFRFRVGDDVQFENIQRQELDEDKGPQKKIGYVETTLHAPLDKGNQAISYWNTHFKGNVIAHGRASVIFDKNLNDAMVMPEETQSDLMRYRGKKAPVTRESSESAPTYDNIRNNILATHTYSALGIKTNSQLVASPSFGSMFLEAGLTPTWFDNSFIVPTRSWNSLSPNLHIEKLLVSDDPQYQMLIDLIKKEEEVPLQNKFAKYFKKEIPLRQSNLNPAEQAMLRTGKAKEAGRKSHFQTVKELDHFGVNGAIKFYVADQPAFLTNVKMLYLKSSLYETIKNAGYTLEQFNDNLGATQQVDILNTQKAIDIGKAEYKNKVGDYNFKNPSAIPVFMQRYAAHGFDREARTTMIKNILTQYNKGYFRGTIIRKAFNDNQITEYERDFALSSDPVDNYAGGIRTTEVYENANEKFLKYFDKINADMKIGEQKWSDHHPEYQEHLIFSEFNLPAFEDVVPNITDKLPYNEQETKNRMKKIVEELNEQYRRINDSRKNFDPLYTPVNDITTWRDTRNTQNLSGSLSSDYGRYYDNLNINEEKRTKADDYVFSQSYDKDLMKKEIAVGETIGELNAAEADLDDIENNLALHQNTDAHEDAMTRVQELKEDYGDFLEQLIKASMRKNGANFSTLFDPHQHVFDPTQLNLLEEIDFDKISNKYDKSSDPRFGVSFVTYMAREIVKHDYLNGLNDFGYTVFDKQTMDRLENALSRDEATSDAFAAWSRLEDVAYNPLNQDAYITRKFKDVIEADDIPLSDAKDFYKKMLLGNMMLAKKLNLDKVIIPNASEVINLRVSPTPEQMVKLGRLKYGTQAFKEYKTKYFAKTRKEGKTSQADRRRAFEELYNIAREEVVEDMKKDYGAVEIPYKQFYKNPNREVPATILKFPEEFDPDKDMIKYNEGGLVQLNGIQQKLNLYTDSKAFGDIEYAQDAIQQAIESGIVPYNFKMGGVPIPPAKPPMIDYRRKEGLGEIESKLMFEDPLYAKYPESFYAYRKRNFDYPRYTKDMSLYDKVDQDADEFISKQLGNVEFEAEMIPKFRTTALGRLGFTNDPKVVTADDAYQQAQGSYRPSDMSITLTNDPKEGDKIRANRRIYSEKNPLKVPPYKLPHPELERLYILNAENPTPEHEAIHRAIHILQNYYKEDRKYIRDKYGKRTDEVLFVLLNPDERNNDYFQLANEVLTEQNDAIRSGAESDIETYLNRTIKERDADLKNYKEKFNHMWSEDASIADNVNAIASKTGQAPRHILNRIQNIPREDHEQLATNIFNIITDELSNLEELAKERLYDRNPDGRPTIDARGLAKGSLDEGFYDNLKVKRNTNESSKGFIQRQIQKFRDRRNLKSNISASESMDLGGRF
jgi:hypothetical protein